MSAREFKPGDVAMVRYKLMGEWREDMRVRAEHPPLDSEVWWGLNGWIGDSTAKEARPLVIIDPDDEEQVERLWEALRREAFANHAGHLVRALRSLIAPSKPEEPQGLGAVVEDAEGVRWIKIDEHVDCNDWTPLGAPTRADVVTVRWRYSEIAAVRILSGGVA